MWRVLTTRGARACGARLVEEASGPGEQREQRVHFSVFSLVFPRIPARSSGTTIHARVSAKRPFSEPSTKLCLPLPKVSWDKFYFSL